VVDNLSFGYWVMRQRKALDLTRAELAAQVHCAPVTIKKIERDERLPSLQMAELLAGALSIAPGARKLFLQAARGETPVDRLHLAAAPLLSPVGPRHNLPAQSTPFIGRESELAEIANLLADSNCRLLSLVGPPGSGKSRLALKAAESQISRFQHGVYLVSLAGVALAGLLPGAIAAGLGLEPQDLSVSQLLSCLRQAGWLTLLVLDNFDHLLDGADLISDLLLHAPGLKLMVTSSQRLNVQSEWVLPLGGLSYPCTEAGFEADQYSAMTLFIQTARRMRGSFRPDDKEMAHVARICQLVEGLPLAIELAATWTRSLTCQEIAGEIEKGLDILNTSIRDIPERHRSMCAVFDQSWKLLTKEEQQVLPLLSVFCGGFTRQSARHVTGASLSVLSDLVDKSFVRLDNQPDGNSRYYLHELIRKYAGQKLWSAGEEAAGQARKRHLEYYVGLAERAAPELQGRGQTAWLNRLESDYDNLRAGFIWAVQSSSGKDGELAQRLMNALHRFFELRGQLEEAGRWADLALQMDSQLKPF
jgi:predicted ATPase/DNA-binding XRE family transcriptional regulator